MFSKKALCTIVVLFTAITFSSCDLRNTNPPESSTTEIPQVPQNPISSTINIQTENEIFDKFATIQLPGLISSPEFQTLRKNGDMRLYFIPDPEYHKENLPTYDYLNIWIRPCSHLCLNLANLDTFRQNNSDEFTTTLVNVFPGKVENIYYLINATAQNKEPYKEMVTAFEYNNYYVQITVGEQFAIEESTLYDDEIIEISTPYIEQILEFLNQE